MIASLTQGAVFACPAVHAEKSVDPLQEQVLKTPSSNPIASVQAEINDVWVDLKNHVVNSADSMDQPATAPSEANAEPRRYQYKLGNYDNSWTDLDSDRTNIVPNLDPGTYSLQIRASDDKGRWSDEGTSLSIAVVQPWWEFWWFRASLVILAICIGYGIYLYTTTRHMDAVSKLRNSIALDLHDEVGSTMSSIYIASRLIQTNPSIQDPRMRELIDKMVVNSEYIMDSMSDIVWTLNSGMLYVNSSAKGGLSLRMSTKLKTLV